MLSVILLHKDKDVSSTRHTVHLQRPPNPHLCAHVGSSIIFGRVAPSLYKLYKKIKKLKAE